MQERDGAEDEEDDESDLHPATAGGSGGGGGVKGSPATAGAGARLTGAGGVGGAVETAAGGQNPPSELEAYALSTLEPRVGSSRSRYLETSRTARMSAAVSIGEPAG